MSVFGPIITGTDVRHAVEATIRLWIDAYLAEIGSQHGRNRGDLPPFYSYRSSAKGFQHWPEDQLPACIIMSPGLDDLEVHSNEYSAEWPIGVGVLCSSLDQDSTNELVELYTAAVRALIVQHGSLGGFAAGTRWISEDYNELPFNKSRSLSGGVVNLGVRVDAVLDSSAGLTTPPEDPNADPGNLPDVALAGVEVNKTVGQIDEQGQDITI